MATTGLIKSLAGQSIIKGANLIETDILPLKRIALSFVSENKSGRSTKSAQFDLIFTKVVDFDLDINDLSMTVAEANTLSDGSKILLSSGESLTKSAFSFDKDKLLHHQLIFKQGGCINIVSEELYLLKTADIS